MKFSARNICFAEGISVLFVFWLECISKVADAPAISILNHNIQFGDISGESVHIQRQPRRAHNAKSMSSHAVIATKLFKLATEQILKPRVLFGPDGTDVPSKSGKGSALSTLSVYPAAAAIDPRCPRLPT